MQGRGSLHHVAVSVVLGPLRGTVLVEFGHDDIFDVALRVLFGTLGLKALFVALILYLSGDIAALVIMDLFDDIVIFAVFIADRALQLAERIIGIIAGHTTLIVLIELGIACRAVVGILGDRSEIGGNGACVLSD